jgi:class 3 adenylate cyclase
MQPEGPRDASLIFAVDDDEEIRDLYRLFLAQEGYRLEVFESADGFVDRVRAEEPDLILLDVMLGSASGFDICRSLKSDPATALVPVVLVTALDGREDRIRGLECGADEFLSKPIYKEELRARVRSLLRLHAMRKALENERLNVELEKRNALRRTFERYVSPKIVAQILEGGGSLSLGSDDRVEAVALFVDMRGFTRLSENLRPRQVVELLNTFFSRLTEIAYRHDGTVFNMAGDCLFVGFGVPVPLDNPELRALQAAREMIMEFEEMAREWRESHGVRVGVGIGINRGDVVAGNIGSPSYTSFTAIGDTVNVAARLMQRAAAGEVIVSQAVREAIGDAVPDSEWEAEMPLKLKGRTAPVRVYRLRPRRAG